MRKLVDKSRQYLSKARKCGLPVMVGKWSASLPYADAMMTPEDGFPYEKDIVIPESVTFHGETFYIREIAANAFRECSLITNIHIPPTITTINNSALRNCCRIKGLYLPPSLRNLYYEPFASCRSLTNVSWPASATMVPRNCFVACVFP